MRTLLYRLNKTFFAGTSKFISPEQKKIMALDLFFCNISKPFILNDRLFLMKCRILHRILPDVIADLGIKRLPVHFEDRAKKYIEKFSQTNVPAKKLDYIRSLLTLVNEFLKRGLCKNDVELDSLLLYLFYCIVLAEPRNMVSDAKLLYISLAKEDEIRLLGNLAVQVLAALQFLSEFVSDLCRRMRRAKFFVSRAEQVATLRAEFDLEPLKVRRKRSTLTLTSQKTDTKISNSENQQIAREPKLKTGTLQETPESEDNSVENDNNFSEQRLHKKLDSDYRDKRKLVSSHDKQEFSRLSKLNNEDNDESDWEQVHPNQSGVSQAETVKLPQTAMLKSDALELAAKLKDEFKDDDESSEYSSDSDFVSEVDTSKYKSNGSQIIRIGIFE